MGLNPFLTFYINAMLNFDGHVDANANIKSEHTVIFNTGTITWGKKTLSVNRP